MLHPDTLTALLEFLVGACPPRSGDRSLTFHQFHTDAFLYDLYARTINPHVSFNTFRKYKTWLRVRKVKTYWGMFDCHRCLRLRIVPAQLRATLDPVEQARLQEELEACQEHHALVVHQRVQYTAMRAALKPRQLLVLMDFTSANLTD